MESLKPYVCKRSMSSCFNMLNKEQDQQTKPNGVGDAYHQGINNLGGSSIGSYSCCGRYSYNKWATYHCNRVPKKCIDFSLTSCSQYEVHCQGEVTFNNHV